MSGRRGRIWIAERVYASTGLAIVGMRESAVSNPKRFTAGRYLPWLWLFRLCHYTLQRRRLLLTLRSHLPRGSNSVDMLEEGLKTYLRHTRLANGVRAAVQAWAENCARSPEIFSDTDSNRGGDDHANMVIQTAYKVWRFARCWFEQSGWKSVPNRSLGLVERDDGSSSLRRSRAGDGDVGINFEAVVVLVRP